MCPRAELSGEAAPRAPRGGSRAGPALMATGDSEQNPVMSANFRGPGARFRSLSRGVWGTVRLVPDELLFDDDCDDEDDGDGPAVTIIEERPPLREGKVFVDYGERAAISENLEAAYVALNQAFRGIWIEKALEYGHVREYWDEEDIDELEMLTLDASSAVKRAWRALSDVTDAHTAQREAEGEDGEGG